MKSPHLITDFSERYNDALTQNQMKREFEKDQLIYHKIRGNCVFECYSPEYNCAWVKFDDSLGGQKVTLSLLENVKLSKRNKK